MTTHDSHSPLAGPTTLATRPPRTPRWLLAAGASVVAALAVAGATQFGDNDDHQVSSRTILAVETTDYTRSTRLIQAEIDKALAQRRITDYTRSTRLIQAEIDKALAQRRITDYTRSTRLIQAEIDKALAQRRDP